MALHEATPESLRETEIHRFVSSYQFPHLFNDVINRDTNKSLAEYDEKGKVFWNSVYGDTSNNLYDMLYKVYPDLGEFRRVGRALLLIVLLSKRGSLEP